ncbi:rCG28697 [Rattus norvegicus]|uniref:RCG28697 n=1 Tax=Rattus norvegicus TaxID=10116 RepID=A6HV55_RAT|nr:rCG28697 [Rattus norvegicus]
MKDISGGCQKIIEMSEPEKGQPNVYQQIRLMFKSDKTFL